MDIYSEDVLRWLHILAMVYWLGGEWGVFQTSYKVTDRNLSLDERRRHMETAYRIDIMARTGIILLLPLGLHMGFNLGAHEWGGGFLAAVWIVAAGWLSLTWAAFLKRETDAGLTLTVWDERLRYVLIPVLLAVSVNSLVTGAPFVMKWYATKVFLYSLMLIIGLGLRFIMRHWTTIFREIAVKGGTPELEGRLMREINLARVMAYVYWIGISGTCFVGATKLF